MHAADGVDHRASDGMKKPGDAGRDAGLPDRRVFQGLVRTGGTAGRRVIFAEPRSFAEGSIVELTRTSAVERRLRR